jgi:hypothetical protein
MALVQMIVIPLKNKVILLKEVEHINYLAVIMKITIYLAT